MPDTPGPNDFSQMAAQYAATMQQVMAEALAQVDATQEQVRQAHEAALDELAAAREERRKIETGAHEIAEAYIQDHRKKIEAQIREKVLAEIVQNLVNDGQSTAHIQTWTGVSETVIADARRRGGFHKLKDQDARVVYQQEGRGGQVIFQAENSTLHFDWEFGGGASLALIFVPAESHWEARTKLPLTDRLPILHFVGEQVVAGQGGSRYELQDDVLVIY